jgi:enamine deaminase RidA (YjgF/YER057c/UK114 family)
MSTIDARLEALGITLPVPVAPVANYVPFTRSGRVVYISGQWSLDAAGGIKGIVGEDVDVETARSAARLCGINLVAQIKAAAEGDLGRLSRILRLGGFVQAGPDFIEIPQVINGCSDLMVDIFGDRGVHARSAVGVYRIPLGFAVEVDAIVELD